MLYAASQYICIHNCQILTYMCMLDNILCGGHFIIMLYFGGNFLKYNLYILHYLVYLVFCRISQHHGFDATRATYHISHNYPALDHYTIGVSWWDVAVWKRHPVYPGRLYMWRGRWLPRREWWATHHVWSVPTGTYWNIYRRRYDASQNNMAKVACREGYCKVIPP